MRSIAGLITAAENEEAAGRWLHAAELWEQVADGSPNSYRLTRWSLALQEAGQLEKAESASRRAITCDSTDANAWFQLGFVLKDLDRLTEAASALESGLRQRESQPILTVAGSLWRTLGNHEVAEKVLRRSLEIEPNDDEAHFHLGLVLRENRARIEEALHHLREATRLDPALPSGARELGRTLLIVRLADEAREILAMAVQQDPQDAWAHCYLGHAFELLEDLSSARAAYTRAVALDDRVGYFLAALAATHDKLGERDTANALFLKALTKDAGDATANRQYGLFLERSGFLARAVRYLERALSANPDDEVAKAALERASSSHQIFQKE